MIRRAKDWAKRHWPALSLRTHLFAALFLVAALPGVGAVFLRVYENTLVRQTEAELVAQGAALAAGLVAQWPEVQWPGAQRPGAVPDADGRVRPEPPRIDLSANPVLPPRPRPAAAPPPDPVVAAAAARFAPVAAATRRTTLAAVALLDARGTVAAGERPGSLAALPEVRAARAGRPETVLRRDAGYRPVYPLEWLSRAAAIRVHHARPVVVNGEVVGVLLLSRSARGLFRGLYEDRGKIAVGVAVILGLLVLLSGLLSRGIARPIEALGRATRHVAAGRGHVPEPPPTAAIEIRALYADFAVMADRIDRRARYLRDFAHAVAHEFKTPIAGIVGAAELLQDHGATMTGAERDRFLANIAADAARLSHLTARLLDLARADMAEVDHATATPLAPLFRGIAAEQAERGLDVRLPPGDAAAVVAVPAAIVEAALTTLCDNSRQAGARTVRIEASPAGDHVHLRVADDGRGIPAADAARIFEPFFTGRRADGGTGLGLPIARSLLQASGGSIDLVPGDGGATFLLRLPAATA